MNPIKMFQLYRRVSDVVDIARDGAMKKLWKSKVFWFQLLSAGAAVAGVIPLPAETLAVVVGLINIGLRLVTNTGIEGVGAATE